LTEFPHASLCYLTVPEPGKPVLNVQVESGDLVRVIINDVQLAKLLYDGQGIQYGYAEGRA